MFPCWKPGIPYLFCPAEERAMIRTTKFGLVATGLFVFCAVAAAREDKPAIDRDFLIKMSSCGHAAVQYSELAAKQANNQAVKDFANKMVKDHGECNQDLAKIAKDDKIAIVVGLEKDTRAELARLGALKGDEFDRAYLKTMIEGHEKAIGMFEAQSKSGKDEKLNTFATLKTRSMKEHLKEARDLAAKIK